MVEQEKVIVCDFCKEKITKSKCEICHRDLCSSCGKILSINLGKGQISISKILVCSDCNNKASMIKESVDIDVGGEIKKMILDKLKKGMILKNLDDGKGDIYLDGESEDGVKYEN